MLITSKLCKFYIVIIVSLHVKALQAEPLTLSQLLYISNGLLKVSDSRNNICHASSSFFDTYSLGRWTSHSHPYTIDKIHHANLGAAFLGLGMCPGRQSVCNFIFTLIFFSLFSLQRFHALSSRAIGGEL